jgi:hypothetical protein
MCFVSDCGEKRQKHTNCMKVFMEMKLFLVCVSLNVLKDSKRDVGTARHENARKEETVARLWPEMVCWSYNR